MADTLDRIRVKHSTTQEQIEGTDLNSGEFFITYVSNSLYVGNPVAGGEPIRLLTGASAEKAYRDFAQSSIYFVSVDHVDATDSIDNTGQSINRPFRSIERAIVQGVVERRRSYTVLIFQGIYRVQNNPGQALGSLGTGINDVPSNFYNDTARGGIIVPPGCTLLALAPTNTFVLPTFIPNYCRRDESPQFDPIEEAFLCVPDFGAAEGVETSIFLCAARSQILGLSFRDSGFSLTDTTYNSPYNTLLSCVGIVTDTELEDYFLKLEKTYDTLFTRLTVRDEEKILEVNGIDVLSIHALTGLNVSGTDIETLVYQSTFDITSTSESFNEGYAIRAQERALVRTEDVLVKNAFHACYAQSGAVIETDSIQIENTINDTVVAEGGSLTDAPELAGNWVARSIVAPEPLATATRFALATVDYLNNWEYHEALSGAPLYDRLYITFSPDASIPYFLPDQIIYFGFPDQSVSAKLDSNPGTLLSFDAVRQAFYLELDDTYAAGDKWTTGLTPSSYLDVDSGLTPTTDKGKLNSEFSRLLASKIYVDRRIDNREPAQLFFKLRIESLSSVVPLAGYQIAFESLPGTPNNLYVWAVEAQGGNFYDLTVLETNFDTLSSTVTDPFDIKRYNDATFGYETTNPTYAALNSVAAFGSTLTTILATEITGATSLPVASQLVFTFRQSSRVLLNSYIVKDSDTVAYSSNGGGQVYRLHGGDGENQFSVSETNFDVYPDLDSFINRIEIDEVTLKEKITLTSGAEVVIEPGVTLNPSNDAVASHEIWGFVQLADLPSAIHACNADPQDGTYIIDVEDDGNQVISQNILASVIEAKTAKADDRALTEGDSRKFISSADLSTTSLLGVSRIVTVDEVVTTLIGEISQTDPLATEQANDPEYVNRYVLNEGLKSIVATDSQRQNFTPGLNLITAEHNPTTVLAGISVIAPESFALSTAGGSGTYTAIDPIEQNSVFFINPFVLRSVLDSRSATAADLTTGTGDGWVTSSDIATTDLFGIVNMTTEPALHSVINSGRTGTLDFITDPQENDATVTVNAYHLNAAFLGRQPESAQRATIGADNLLVDYSHGMTGTLYGIGRVVDHTVLVTDLEGDLSFPDATISSGEQDNPTLVNRYNFVAGINSIKAQNSELTRSLLDITANRLINVSNIVQTDRYGIGVLATENEGITIAGGNNPGYTPPGAAVDSSLLMNVYNVRSVIESRYATSAELTAADPVGGIGQFVSASDSANDVEHGIVRQYFPLNNAPLLAELATESGANDAQMQFSVGTALTSTRVVTAEAAGKIVQGHRATDAERADGATTFANGNYRHCTVDQTATVAEVGYVKQTDLDDLITIAGGNPALASSLTSLEQADERMVNPYVWSETFASLQVSGATEANSSLGGKYISPANIAGQDRRGIARLATETIITDKVTSADGDTGFIQTTYSLDKDQLVGIDGLFDIIESLKATSAQKQNTGTTPGTTIGLIGVEDKGSQNNFGVVRAHDTTRAFIDVLPLDYLSVQALLDASTSYATIKESFIPTQSTLPIGTIIDFGGDFVPTGYLLCDGGSHLIATYPDLANALIGRWGNPASYTGQTQFVVPDLRAKTTSGDGSWTDTLGTTAIYGHGTIIGQYERTLVESNIPQHTHPVTVDPHSHRILLNDPAETDGDNNNDGALSTFDNGSGNPATYNQVYRSVNGLAAPLQYVEDTTVNVSVGDTGSGTAFFTLTPSGVVKKVIKAL